MHSHIGHVMATLVDGTMWLLHVLLNKAASICIALAILESEPFARPPTKHPTFLGNTFQVHRCTLQKMTTPREKRLGECTFILNDLVYIHSTRVLTKFPTTKKQIKTS